MSQENAARIVGERIRHYRTMRNLTQEELAEKISSTGSYIGRIERGEQNVKLETLEKIASALELNVFIFFQQDVPDPLRESPWIKKSVALLLKQPEQQQQKAFRILHELFSE